VALADDPDDLGELNNHPLIKDLPNEVAQQATVVKRAERIDVECVVRAYLTGSALVDYNQTGTIFGIPVPAGLVDGSKLPELLFTPTTKAETGHDEPMTMDEVAELTGADLAAKLQELSFAVFQHAHDVAAARGIILADTKFEFGIHDGGVILIDEVLTPDSSRFWDGTQYAPGKSQPNYDKQFVRDWLLEQVWDRKPPAPALPGEIVTKTTERYLEAYRRLTGEGLA
jgi:phosphoribosylaminoimidazole-succinocarboxamide synthase